MKQGRIAKNYIYQSAANLISVLVPLVTTPYLSRVLGPEGIGISSYTGSVVATFGMFAVLGVHDYGRLVIAGCGGDLQKRSRVFYELMFCKSIASLAIVPLYFLYVWRAHSYVDYSILQSIFLLSCLTDTGWVYQGIEEFRQLAVRTIVTRIGSVFLIMGLVRGKGDLGIALLISLLTTLFSNLVLFIPLRDKLCRVKLGELHPGKHAKSVISFFLPILAAQLYLHIDKIMIGGFSVSIVESGYYEQSRKVAEIVSTFIVTINTVMVPRIAYLYTRGESGQIKKYYRYSFHFILMLALPAAMGLFLISDHFVPWFFGEGYGKVIILMKMSGVMIVFTCVGSFAGSQYLIPTRQQNKATIIYVITSCLNILLNLLMIPRYFSIGAMVASLVAEGFSCTLQMCLLLRSSYRFSLFKGVHRILLGTVLMGSAIWAFQHVVSLSLAPMLFLEVIVGIIVYGACLIVLKEPVVQEWKEKILR